MRFFIVLFITLQHIESTYYFYYGFMRVLSSSSSINGERRVLIKSENSEKLMKVT